jgi:hypothetical protein
MRKENQNPLIAIEEKHKLIKLYSNYYGMDAFALTFLTFRHFCICFPISLTQFTNCVHITSMDSLRQRKEAHGDMEVNAFRRFLVGITSMHNEHAVHVYRIPPIVCIHFTICLFKMWKTYWGWKTNCVLNNGINCTNFADNGFNCFTKKGINLPAFLPSFSILIHVTWCRDVKKEDTLL